MRYKRYGPISHDINGDADVWEFTEKFGERSFRTIVEVWMIIDRTENHWRLTGDWSGNLSRKVRQSVANVRRQIEHMIATGWLIVVERAADNSPLVLAAARYADYHRKRGAKKHNNGTNSPPKGDTFGSAPILSDPIPHSSNEECTGLTPALSKNSIPEWETSVVDLMAFDPRRFERLDAFVGWAKGQKYRDAEIALGLSRLRDAVRKDLVAGDWWGYARVLLQKAAIDVAQQEHEQRKREEREFATLTLIAPRKADA